MEPYIKNNLSDITYMSELIPHSCFRKKAGGIKFVLRFALGLDWTILKRSEGSRTVTYVHFVT